MELGASNQAPISGGTGTGKASFSDLNFTCPVNKASSELFLACASGTHIKSANIFVRRAGGNSQDYYILTLTDIVVTSFQQGGPRNDATSNSPPTESYSFTYSKIEWNYTAADGSAQKAGWDLKANVRL